jgi:hypothetical protein
MNSAAAISDIEVWTPIAGAALSLAASYFPGVSAAYDRLTPNGKRLIMAVLVVAVGVGSALWSCESSSPLLSCLNRDTLRSVIVGVFKTAVANQATHRLTPATSCSSSVFSP